MKVASLAVGQAVAPVAVAASLLPTANENVLAAKYVDILGASKRFELIYVPAGGTRPLQIATSRSSL